MLFEKSLGLKVWVGSGMGAPIPASITVGPPLVLFGLASMQMQARVLWKRLSVVDMGTVLSRTSYC